MKFLYKKNKRPFKTPNPPQQIKNMFPFFSYSSNSFLLLLFFFITSLHSFPARNLPEFIPDDLVTVLPAIPNNYTWSGFNKFLDVCKGSEVGGMSELKKYLHRFGYLPFTDPNNFTDIFDDRFETALIQYQSKLGLPTTGKLDSTTLSQVMSPRCGVRDTVHTIHGTKHYAYFPGRPRWNQMKPTTLTYGFSPDHSIDYISESDIKAVFKRVFVKWASVIPVNFTEAQDYKKADIKIGFYKGDHGDGEPFDGVLGVLAHAFSPENGRFHLDAAETWTVDFGSDKSRTAVDLESVATHEIGHILGLAHSSVKESVMYPSLSPRSKKVDLKLDDVEGVQALYGSNPNFKFSSLIESDTSSNNHSVGLRSKMSNWASSISLVILLFIFCI